MSLVSRMKIGFMGAGNLSQIIIKALLEKKVVPPQNIFVSNRSVGKLQKVQDTFGVVACKNNEDLIEQCDVVILAMKPQDLPSAIEPLRSCFNPDQIVISLAAGISLSSLEKLLPDARLVRVMPNTPSSISRGVIGCCLSDNSPSLVAVIEDLFSPLGYVQTLEDESMLDALAISCASGTGFVFELMLYWQEWIEEHGFDRDVAKKMTVETFLGASMLAAQSLSTPIEELLAKVTSKKGITEAGLQSMRELEIERALRYSFEKAAIRNQELSRTKINH
jgi:pyrroline-5-carboxylate reductase